MHLDWTFTLRSRSTCVVIDGSSVDEWQHSWGSDNERPFCLDVSLTLSEVIWPSTPMLPRKGPCVHASFAGAAAFQKVTKVHRRHTHSSSTLEVEVMDTCMLD